MYENKIMYDFKKNYLNYFLTESFIPSKKLKFLGWMYHHAMNVFFYKTYQELFPSLLVILTSGITINSLIETSIKMVIWWFSYCSNTWMKEQKDS